MLASASARETRWVDLDGLEGGTRQGNTEGGYGTRLWNVTTGEPIATFPPLGHTTAVVFSPDGSHLAEKLFYGTVNLWDVSEWMVSSKPEIVAVETNPPEAEDGEIADDEPSSAPQAWLTPDPAEVAFSADDPAWKTFTVHTSLDSVLVHANPSGSDPAIEVEGGARPPTRLIVQPKATIDPEGAAKTAGTCM